MAKFKLKRCFGLDISESAIKLVEIKKTREGFRIGKARLIELNIDPIFDDSEKRNSAIKNGLHRLFLEEGAGAGSVALSISGQSVFIRPLKVPKIAKNKIEQIIHYEAQLQVPFPINEVIWNYELSETHDSPETEVILVAVKKDIVEDKLKFIAESGLEVEFVEVDSFALYNAWNHIDDIKDKIILDIGAKITDIIIAEERKLWTRSILIGGNDLTRAIAASLKLSFREAEKLKKKEGVVAIKEEDRAASPRAGAISDVITPVLVELLTNVSKSVGYYKSQFEESRLFREILITGGGSKLKNIAEFIHGNIDISTRVINIFDKVKDSLDFQPGEEMIGRMDVGIGLALRTINSLTTKTNLLPKEMFYTKEFEKKKWYIFGSLAVIVAIFAVLNLFMQWSYKRQEYSLEKAKSMVVRYNELYQVIGRHQNKIDNLRSRLDFIAKTAKDRKEAIITFTELVRLLPPNLWLTDMTQENGSFLIQGKVKGTFESISLFKNTLADSEFFAEAEVESADVVVGTNEEIRAFAIRIKKSSEKDEAAGESKDSNT